MFKSYEHISQNVQPMVLIFFKINVLKLIKNALVLICCLSRLMRILTRLLILDFQKETYHIKPLNQSLKKGNIKDFLFGICYNTSDMFPFRDRRWRYHICDIEKKKTKK